MTIINATPDSFYEGSRTPRADDVARRAERQSPTARPFSTWAAIRPGRAPTT